MDERITASEGNSMQIANILKGIDERSRQTETALSTITPAFAQLCAEFAARGNAQAQIGWIPPPPAATNARARGVAGALMPSAPAGTAETKVDSDAGETMQNDESMTESASAEPAEPPSKQPKTSGSVGAPPGAEADDYDSSEEEVATEQPMSKIATCWLQSSQRYDGVRSCGRKHHGTAARGSRCGQHVRPTSTLCERELRGRGACSRR